MPYYPSMKSLTIRLPDALATEIENESRSRRISKSEVVREWLRQPPRVINETGSVRDMIGDILQKSWEAHVPAGPLRPGSRKKQKLAERIRAKKQQRSRMTRPLAEERAVGAASRKKFDGTAFLKLLKVRAAE